MLKLLFDLINLNILLYYKMKEGPLIMVLHGSIIAAILYTIMKYILKQSSAKALSRSVLCGLLASSYMIVFGHNLPTHISGDL
tara:strand:- start:714 stop:962 length:249 start_codon:yes stop_codon:yes gene_type:complete